MADEFAKLCGVTALRVAERPVNKDVLALAEEVLERVRAGETSALAVVEVGPAGEVSFSRSHQNQFHLLNSGCALLANMMASERD